MTKAKIVALLSVLALLTLAAADGGTGAGSALPRHRHRDVGWRASHDGHFGRGQGRR